MSAADIDCDATRDEAGDDLDAPRCFHLEQALEPLAAPAVVRHLKLAFRARSSGVAQVVRAASALDGFHLELPATWPPQPAVTDTGQRHLTLAMEDEADAEERDRCGDSPSSPSRSPRRRHPSPTRDEVPASGDVGIPSTESAYLAISVPGASDATLEHLRGLLTDLAADEEAVPLAMRFEGCGYLICSRLGIRSVALVLLRDGHAIRPAKVALGPTAADDMVASGTFRGCGGFDAYAGVWADEAHSDTELPARLRFVASSGLFAEIHLSSEPRAIAGVFLDMDEDAPGTVAQRHAVVDTEPATWGDLPTTRVVGNDMNDCFGDSLTWRRFAGSSEMAVLELPVASRFRRERNAPTTGCDDDSRSAGLWIFCGGYSLRVWGAPRGVGLLGSCSCKDSKQLRSILGAKVLNRELRERFSAVLCKQEGPGKQRCVRGLWNGEPDEGEVLLGAKGEADGRIISASLVRGLMTHAGTVTVRRRNCGIPETWMIREFDDVVLGEALAVAGSNLIQPNAGALRVIKPAKVPLRPIHPMMARFPMRSVPVVRGLFRPFMPMVGRIPVRPVPPFVGGPRFALGHLRPPVVSSPSFGRPWRPVQSKGNGPRLPFAQPRAQKLSTRPARAQHTNMRPMGTRAFAGRQELSRERTQRDRSRSPVQRPQARTSRAEKYQSRSRPMARQRDDSRGRSRSSPRDPSRSPPRSPSCGRANSPPWRGRRSSSSPRRGMVRGRSRTDSCSRSCERNHGGKRRRNARGS
eukprot:TRINITY_DN26963_c0_g1_i1.p1 TRINITY_DN26963_c0_g1~~TRINITY_DN26963_c0_g1_i1.p1  ORF type:complete len:751 (+),score=54.03 TRINITY_DN26963_c0_g1_i1:72-2324(+)